MKRNFFRKVAFGIGPNQEVPINPIDWSQTQVENVPKIDILPLVGLNVYDILRRDYLVFSSSAVTGIHERLNK